VKAVVAFFWREEVAGIADVFGEVSEASGTGAIDLCLEFRQCHSGQVQIR
jgi:hypothetical protein